MKLSMLALGAALTFHVATQGALAQDHSKDAKSGEAMDPQQMMEACAELGKPGSEHKRLEPFVGEWNVKATFWMEPGAPATDSTGKAKIEWILDGHYLRQHYTGDFMGETFKGEALWGYNKVTGEYFGTWIDSMSTGMSTSTGSVSADGKTFTYNSSFDDPMTGQKCNSREVVQIVGKDEFKMTAYMVNTDGSEFKYMELVYTRKK
jgi:hypothetical protein